MNSQGWNSYTFGDQHWIRNVWKASFEAQSHMHLRKFIKSNGARQSTHDKAWESKIFTNTRGETQSTDKARIFLWWPTLDQRCTKKLLLKLNSINNCANGSTPMKQSIQTRQGLGQPNFHKYKGVLPTTGIKKTILAESRRDPQTVKAGIFLWWWTLDPWCTTKLLTKLTPTLVCTNRSTPTEQDNPTMTRPLTAKIWKSQGVLSTIGIKTYHIKRKWWGTQ